MRSRSQGFTLLEMVITLIVLAILGAVAAYGITGGVLAHSSNTEAVETMGKLRLATERLAREIRQVRRDPLDTSRYDITGPLSASQLAFTKVDATAVTIATTATAVTLGYDDPAGTFVLSDQLSSLTFSYFQADGSSTATTADTVAFVAFELVLTDAHGNDLAQQTRVALRSQP